MPAKLLIREVGQREFTIEGDYHDDVGLILNNESSTAVEKAEAKGRQLCESGNVEAFQVWTLHSSKQRVWTLEDL